MNNTDESLFEGNDIVDNDLAIQLNGGCDGNRFAAKDPLTPCDVATHLSRALAFTNAGRIFR